MAGDDAFGPQVIRRSQAFYSFDPLVTRVDATNQRLALEARLAGAKALIVIETLEGEGQPGELRLLRGARPAIFLRFRRPSRAKQ